MENKWPGLRLKNVPLAAAAALLAAAACMAQIILRDHVADSKLSKVVQTCRVLKRSGYTISG